MNKKILILHFPNLNNYGTGMMGLVTINELYKRLNGEVSFYCDFNEAANIAEIISELGIDVCLKQHQRPWVKKSSHRLKRMYDHLVSSFRTSDIADYDGLIVVGGDDISEYYRKHAWLEILHLYNWSKKKPVFLLGQSIGPFGRFLNRLAVRYLMSRLNVFVRDRWSKNYLASEFDINSNVKQSADLAFYDLPCQHETNIEREILNKYGLESEKYCTLVISGLHGDYYTNNIDLYLDAYEGFIRSIWQREDWRERKVCLLAHTFKPYSDEGELINDFVKRFTNEEKQRLVLVTDRVLQTRARFILGNGLFTITGRMHAAVSTFQAGKPAIALSYSAKYQGVIGINLNRSDLIIESNDAELWDSGEIVDLVSEKVDYLMDNYNRLNAEISEAVNEQKRLVTEAFDSIVEKLS